MRQSRALARVFAVLELLADRPGGRLKEVSAGTGLAAPTASRLCAGLVALGYLRRDAGRYRIGARLAGLGRGFLAAEEDAAIAAALADLAAATGLTAFHVVRDGDEAVYLQRAAPTRAQLLSARRIGARAPLHCTGAGKILLAALDEAALRAWLKGRRLEAWTPRTATSPPELLRRIERARALGWAADDEECEPGLRCLAVPVPAAGGGVRAALSISAPAERLGTVPTPAQLRALRRAAAACAG